MQIGVVPRAIQYLPGRGDWWAHPAAGCPVAEPTLRRWRAACAIRRKAILRMRRALSDRLAPTSRPDEPAIHPAERQSVPEQPRSRTEPSGRQKTAILGEPS